MGMKLDVPPLIRRIAMQDCANKPGCQGPGWDHPPECNCGMEPSDTCREATNHNDMCMACHARAAMAEVRPRELTPRQ